MSYPQGAPGGSGFPPAQQPTTQFSAPTQQFSKVSDADPTADGPSKLPLYLSVGTAVLGLLVYLSSFGPQFVVSAADSAAAAQLGSMTVWTLVVVIAALVAALLAAVSLLPKQANYTAVAAVAAVVGFLIVLAVVISTPSNVSIDWGLYLVIAFSLLQAAVAVVVLLFDSGIITPPQPRPKYDQHQQYGQYPGAYYGQAPGQHGGPQHQQGPQQQRPGYPTPYGGGGYPGSGQTTGGFPGSGQTTGGFPAASPTGQPTGQQSGPPTPPTGFPTYGQPPASNSPTTQTPTQHQGPSSSQSGQSPS
ncbi:hypothetical protein FHR72_002435 [Mycolicibacterium iranicum]|uniref:34 kDa antigenic protein n=1 Tax=Mycolicibacterium iranicum TaxID=912594 RepID=A0A839QCI2_MYCIR|nr:DUF5336 domain-containing protein [Mycolicibacterium iranicum]MBB2990962.1 hypothetical protein [Mycolicibacterium iranicum]